MRHNWAGNLDFNPRRSVSPSTVDELRALVVGSDRLRAIGTGHSFSPIADTDGDQVSLDRLPVVLELDQAGRQVTVSGGVRYGELATYLHGKGWALPNLASLPHLTVAGACATATHGSGVHNGCLSTSVAALELVTADGELRRFDRSSPDFGGIVVGLGAMGVVTSLTLDVVPTFEVRQHVFEGVPWEALADPGVLAAGYSVSLFSTWRAREFEQVWVKRLSDDDSAWPHESWAGKAASGARHPVPGMAADSCTEQLGVPGPWHLRLPHFRLEHTPSAGDELQSEYFVAREEAMRALEALADLRAEIAEMLLVGEIRAIAADTLWLSPAYLRDSVGLHFTWVKNVPGVTRLIAMIEERLEPLSVRPHWGKLFGLAADQLAARYPRYADFTALARRLDPTGKLRNTMLDRLIGS